MARFPFFSDAEQLKRLEPPEGRLDIVLDTDTYNEVDDQFALAYALLSKERLRVQAVYAAPFLNKRSTDARDGMEKSYAEILRLLDKMGIDGRSLAIKGSDRFLPAGDAPVDSPAARDLAGRAAARREDDPLYVVAIGAVTNIASAILLDPEIIRKIVVVWLGGNPLNWHTAEEFNLSQDLPAARLIFDCGAPLIHIPCMGVASHLLTTMPELRAHIGNKNELCDTLIELFAAYTEDHFAWAKELWDISAVARLINPDWVPAATVHSPILGGDGRWSADTRRHFIKSAYFVRRNPIFRDMYHKLLSL